MEMTKERHYGQATDLDIKGRDEEPDQQSRVGDSCFAQLAGLLLRLD